MELGVEFRDLDEPVLGVGFALFSPLEVLVSGVLGFVRAGLDCVPLLLSFRLLRVLGVRVLSILRLLSKSALFLTSLFRLSNEPFGCLLEKSSLRTWL